MLVHYGSPMTNQSFLQQFSFCSSEDQIVMGRNFRKKRECKEANGLNMEGLTEVILFHPSVVGSGEGAQKTLPSLVPDFWMPSQDSLSPTLKGLISYPTCKLAH